MQSDDFNFTKFFLGRGADPAMQATSLLRFLTARASENGLQPVDNAMEAHFVTMIIRSDTDWLHFDFKGHYLPMDTPDYEPVVPDMSHWKDSVTCWVKEPERYTLRRYHKGDLTAAYANLNYGNHYDSRAAAQDWKPIYEDWQPVLAEEITPASFQSLFPAPQLPGEAPTEVPVIPPKALPDNFAIAFGWDPALNRCAVNLPVNEGPGYRSAAGDYRDAASGTVTYVRCFAHPKPGDMYSRHWSE